MLGRLRTASFVTALVAVALASASSGQSPGPPGGTGPSDPPGGITPGGPSGGAPPGLDVAIAVKQRHAEELLDLPGVAGVGVALNPAGRPVISVYKEKQDVADVPSSLEGIDVESTVTGIIEARAPTDRFPRPVPIGVSSGLQEIATGTLGARVTDGTNVYALSNNHVFAGINSASIGDGIIQPGVTDGGSDPADRIGTLHAFQTIDFNGGNNTMDAAIALTTTGNVGTATPTDGYGAPSNVTAQAFIGQAVQKYGRTTGLQLGAVAATNVNVDVCYLLLFSFCLQEARFVGQISVSPGPFSAPGDSGSLIVTQGANQPVALLFAGGDGLTIGTPIDLVLQRFGVTIDGQPPGDGPPGAPTGLSAVAGDGSVSLTWAAPSFDGGSQITGYRIYRGTTSGDVSFLQSSPGSGTSFQDDTVTNGTTYYYKVSAENALGEGALSNEAQATPAGLVPPVEPLAVLDNFNRLNENPLSDAGRWTNAINGGVENGLHVSSEQLACSQTTTCTAWRNNAQYGPDVEMWARVSALPGTNNNIRLYARLQQQGSASYDAYMLRTNQLAGSDEVYLERIDNAVRVTLATFTQELAIGDTLLLRVTGSTIEGWLHNGTSWTRLGTASDSTYPAAGYVGVGLRGTTGRLDDFGGRTMGAPPPDTEPPSAPGTLTASAVDSTQIDLSWGAATDNVAVARYRIERCSGTGCASWAEIATTTATSYSDTDLSASTAYSYRVRAEDTATPTPNLGVYSNTASATTPAAPKPLYFSLLSNGTVGGVSVANEDIVFFDGATFSLAFDGSDVGLSSRRLDAFGWLDPDTLVFSLDTDGAALPGIAGTIDDSDVVRFDATSLGQTTSGSFVMYFDGSDVGLTTNAEDVDAFEMLATGQVLLSTEGSAGVASVSGADEDLLAFTPTTLGTTTSGTFALYFDGSDVGLSANGEDVDAAAVDAAGRIYLSSLDTFAVTGASGADEDVFVFNPSTLGTSTSGSFDSSLYFDGSAFGLAGNDVFAIDLPPGS